MQNLPFMALFTVMDLVAIAHGKQTSNLQMIVRRSSRINLSASPQIFCFLGDRHDVPILSSVVFAAELAGEVVPTEFVMMLRRAEK